MQGKHSEEAGAKQDSGLGQGAAPGCGLVQGQETMQGQGLGQSRIDLPIVYVPTENQDVYWNFGLETYLVEEKACTDRCFLLVWRTQPTFMLGRYQNLLSEVNLPFAQDHGVYLVRRPSGGGCIYTDLGSWQFSFILPETGISGPTDAIDFAPFTRAIVTALNKMGIPAVADGRNDLLVEGKKISGNAQYRKDGFIVHHGSILFNPNLEFMLQGLQPDPYKMSSKGIASVRERVACLEDYVPKDMTVVDFRDRLVEYLLAGQEKAGMMDPCYQLTEEEEQRAADLGTKRFADPARILTMNPPFSLQVDGHFPGGKVSLSVTVEKGLVRQAKLEGDFFGNVTEEEIQSALAGVPYRKEALVAALEAIHLDEKLYQVTSQEIIGLLPCP